LLLVDRIDHRIAKRIHIFIANKSTMFRPTAIRNSSVPIAEAADLARSAATKTPKNAMTAMVLGAGIFAVALVDRNHSSHALGDSSLEQQFGTVDGNFPSATPGATLSRPPGNRERMLGKKYTVPSEIHAARINRAMTRAVSAPSSSS
jgi:hypothetical protein